MAGIYSIAKIDHMARGLWRKARAERDYRRNLSLDPSEYSRALALWYKRKAGRPLNLDNPRTFNEKTQWLKLFGPVREMGRMADKYLVREFVAERIGEEYLTPLLGVWDRPQEIEWDALPKSYALKATHGCGCNIIVDGATEIDRNKAHRQLARWLSIDYSMYGFEMQYRYCVPRIIAEEYMDNGGGDLYDYKLFCFNGRVDSIMFLAERKRGLKMAFFDREWNHLPYVYSFPRLSHDVPKPAQLDKLIVLAETLAEGWPLVRVDFYVLNDGKVRFGEMTFTSASGLCAWDPPETDFELGRKIDLSACPKATEYPWCH